MRIHTDEPAAASARNLKARAFTLGHDVVFDTGEYAPQTKEGQALLAHELAHVVQQSASTSASVIQPNRRRRSGEFRLSPPHLGPRAPSLPHLLPPEERVLDPCVPIIDRILDAFSIAQRAVIEANRRLSLLHAMISTASNFRSRVDADTYCSLVSNFNIDERTPNFVALVGRIQYNLFILASLMRTFDPVRQIVCELPGNPQCASGDGQTYRGFAVRGGPPPIHLCPEWRENPDLGPKTILHEVAHLTGRADNQYIRLITLALTSSDDFEMTLPAAGCRKFQRFTIGPDLTVDNADSYAFFVMDFR